MELSDAPRHAGLMDWGSQYVLLSFQQKEKEETRDNKRRKQEPTGASERETARGSEGCVGWHEVVGWQYHINEDL